MDESYGIRIAFRIVFALIIAIIVFTVIFNIILEGSLNYNDWLWNLLIIVYEVWIVSWLFRWPMNHYWYHERETMILRRRYARGEITEAQFKKMMKVLKDSIDHHRSSRRRR